MEIKDFKKKLAAAIDAGVKERMKGEREGILKSLGKEVSEMLAPAIKEIAATARANKEDMRSAMMEAIGALDGRTLAGQGIDTGALIEAIHVAFGGLRMPEPKVTVNTPGVKLPDFRFGNEGEMSIGGWVRLMGISLDNPLPVQLRDSKGNPIRLFDNMTQALGGSGGGKMDFFTIKDIRGSSASLIDQTEGALRVTGSFTATIGSTYAQLANADGPVTSSNPVPVTIASGSTGGTQYPDAGNAEPGTGGLVMGRDANGSVYALRQGSGTSETALRMAFATDSIGSVYVTGAAASTYQEILNPDGRVKVELPSGASGLTDTELRASHLDVQQVSGATDSVYVQNPAGPGEQATALRVVVAGDSGASVYANNPAGQGDEATALRVVVAGNSGVSTSAAQSGAWSVSISGSLASTVAVGPTQSDALDADTPPVQIGGIARTANPTAVGGGDAVKSTHDDLGRQIMRPVQVRDLIATAYATISNGTETTLRAAVAGAYLDLIYVMGANNSDAAVSVDIRPVTAGNIVMTLMIPASGTAGIACPVPLPQADTGNNWTADMGDITGTTVSLTALFSQEV